MEILILTALVAAFLRFVHFCIGSPSANEYVNGRIFSLWGRFITIQYSRHHNKETKRIWGKYDTIKGIFDREFESDLASAQSDDEKKQITDIYLTKISDLQSRTESWRKTNPFNMMGACFICFATWLSLAMWLIIVPVLGLNPIYLILCVAGSVVLANRIDL